MIGDQDRRTAWARIISANPNWVAASLFAVAMIPLLVTPVLPLIDFYDHLARFYVLAHVGSNSLLQQYYVAHWSLLPDIGVDVVATPLLKVLPPLIAAKVIVAAILAALYSGVLYFHRAVTGQKSLLIAVLLLPLLYSYILNWGFANFLLGLGLAFWAAGWWLNHRHRPFFATPISCLLALLIFLSHGVAFMLYGVIVASIEVGFFINTPTRKPFDLVRSLFPVMLQAVIPLTLFVAWEMGLSSDGSAIARATLTSQPYIDSLTIRPGHMGLRRLATILRVEEGPAYWFDMATLAIQAGIIWFLAWRRQMEVARIAWVLIALGAILIVFMPSKFLGVNYIADRMPLFAVLCFLGALSPVHGERNGESKIGIAILCLVVAARLVAIAINWHGYAQDYREFRSIADRIPSGSMILEVKVGAGRHETEVPRCEMYGPLLVTQYNQITPLFAFPGQQPLVLAGRLKTAADLLLTNPIGAHEVVNDYNAYMEVAASAGFDLLLVCNAQLLTQPFPQNVSLIGRTEHFSLLRVVR